MKNALLEVIACSIEDAVEAERGGAGRLEIISRFDVGGLTPSLDLVREIKSKFSIPLRAMLRESTGYEVSGERQVEKLCSTAHQLNTIGIDGIVLGFLQTGEVDFELTGKILACAPDLKATFHHAFEDATDKFSVIEKLKELPQIDRILAHGGHEGTWAEKIKRLEEYSQAAQPEIRILAGGGIDLQIISMILAKTSIREIHVGSAARLNGKVDRLRTAMLTDALRGNYDQRLVNRT